MTGSERIVAVGCDVQGLGSVAESLSTFGDAYLRRVLHPAELRRCAGIADRGALVRVVGRHYAAKEAVAKTLGLRADDALPWADIEIVLDGPGGGTARLHGSAGELAERRGIARLRVTADDSETEFVVAMAIATALISPTGGRAD